MKLSKLLLVAMGFAFATASQAQSWPQKSVRFIVPFPPGGATDISARLLGQKLTEIWGQTVVIENRGGAGGGVGAAEAARAAPDGYTLFFPSGSVVTANQHIYAKMNYDPEKDFVPVTKVVSGPQVLVVPANSPYKSGEGADRRGQGAARQAHLRPRRHRFADASGGGELRQRGEDRRRRGALQGRGPGAGGAGRRRDHISW